MRDPLFFPQAQLIDGTWRGPRGLPGRCRETPTRQGEQRGETPIASHGLPFSRIGLLFFPISPWRNGRVISISSCACIDLMYPRRDALAVHQHNCPRAVPIATSCQRTTPTTQGLDPMKPALANSQPSHPGVLGDVPARTVST